MKIFNVGELELVFIVALALIIMGPKDITRAARTLGQWLKKIKSNPYWQTLVKTSAEIHELPQKILAECRLDETVMSMNKLSHNLQHALSSEATRYPSASISLQDSNRRKTSPEVNSTEETQ